jgi:hypothetical protein
LTLARLETGSSTTLHDDGWTTYLLGTVARAWLRTAAAADTTTANTTDDTFLSASTVASHAKAAQRILWNAATKRDDLLDPVDCLRLQQLAIEVYLLLPSSSSEQESTVVLSVAVQTKLQSHFATACTMAWKASESFLLGIGNDLAASAPSVTSTTAQQPLDGGTRFDVVSAFHARLGPHLDAMAAGWNCTDEPQAVVPGSYFEYCAYRALHLSRRLDKLPPPPNRTNLARHCNCRTGCVFSNFALPCPHHVCGDDTMAVPASATISTNSVALVYLALTVRNGLEALLQTTFDPKHTVATCEAAVSPWLVSQADTIQSSFQQLVKSTTTIVEDGGTFGGLRLHKVLSALSLHKLLQTVVSRQSDSRIALQPFALTLCHTATTLLADCVGPLCFRLSNIVEGKQSLSIASMGIASLRSAIALSELLHNETALEYFLVSTTNRWMCDLVHQLTSQERQRSAELMETTARVRHQS